MTKGMAANIEIASESHGEAVQDVMEMIAGIFGLNTLFLLFIILIKMRLNTDNPILVINP